MEDFPEDRSESLNLDLYTKRLEFG
jgi:hypothetical protein